MRSNGMVKEGKYQYDATLNVETVLFILKELYPERKVYYRTTVAGRFACVNVNKSKCLMCKVKPQKDNSSIKVIVSNNDTVFGALLLGGLIGYALCRKTSQDMIERIFVELDRSFVRIE